MSLFDLEAQRYLSPVRPRTIHHPRAGDVVVRNVQRAVPFIGAGSALYQLPWRSIAKQGYRAARDWIDRPIPEGTPALKRVRTIRRSASRTRSVRKKTAGKVRTVIRSNRMVGRLQPRISFGTIKGNYANAYRLKIEKGDHYAFTGDCGYLGHGMSQLYFTTAIIAAIVKELASRASIPFYAVSDFVGGQHKDGAVGTWTPKGIELIYRKIQGGDIHRVGIGTIDSNNIWETVINNFRTTVYALALNEHETFIPVEVRLISTIATENVTLSYIDLTSYKMHFAFVSKLFLHNVTDGASTTDTNMLSVEANPLNSKRYYNFGRTLNFRRNQDAATSGGCFEIPKNQVHKVYEWADANFGSDLQTLLRRPPPKTVFQNCIQTGSSMIGAGGIEVHTIKYEISGTVPMFFEKRVGPGAGASYGNVECGLNEWIGFDKLVHSSNSTAPIDVQFEIQQTYMSKITKKKRHWMPEVVVAT